MNYASCSSIALTTQTNNIHPKTTHPPTIYALQGDVGKAFPNNNGRAASHIVVVKLTDRRTRVGGKCFLKMKMSLALSLTQFINFMELCQVWGSFPLLAIFGQVIECWRLQFSVLNFFYRLLDSLSNSSSLIAPITYFGKPKK